MQVLTQELGGGAWDSAFLTLSHDADAAALHDTHWVIGTRSLVPKSVQL